MRKIFAHLDNNAAVGCHRDELIEVPFDESDDQISQHVHQMAVEQAESYFSVEPGDYVADEDEEGHEWAVDFIYEGDVDSYWEDYDPAKHDMYLN